MAAVLGAYALLYPRARVVTLIIIIIFITVIELPALLVLGLWFLMQLYYGSSELTQPVAGGGVAYWAHIGGFLFGLAWSSCSRGARTRTTARTTRGRASIDRAQRRTRGRAALIGTLAFLTLSVAIEHGVDVLVVLSLIILAMLGFGVLGALTTPPDE